MRELDMDPAARWLRTHSFKKPPDRTVTSARQHTEPRYVFVKL